MKAFPDGVLPNTPGGRFEFLMDLYAPCVYDEETGELIGRDPSLGVISRDDLLELSDAPRSTSPEQK